MELEEFKTCLRRNGVWTANIGANAMSWHKAVTAAVEAGLCSFESFLEAMSWRPDHQPTYKEALEQVVGEDNVAALETALAA